MRRCRLAHGGDFKHQLLVDMQPSGRVEHHDVVALAPPDLQRAPGDLDRALPRHDRQCRDADLAAELGQLLLRRRALHVERGHQHLLALAVLQPQRDLGAGRRLARALQTHQHDPDRRRRVQVDAVAPWPPGRRRLAAEHLDEMIVHDLDDHLPRRHRAQHLLADRLLAHRIDEIAHDRQGDIGFEQRDADLAHRARDIVLAQRAVPAQPVEDIVQAIAEGVEHG